MAGVTSTCNAEYMVLALATKQWIWLTNALHNLNVLVIIASISCDITGIINIDYNPKRGVRSKHIDIAYDLVYENIESGPISLLQVE
jgi:hypothetical protein